MIRILTPAILAMTIFAASAAVADDDDCRSPMSQWQSQDAAMQHATSLGIEVRRLKIDDGCFEIKGSDRDGNKVELKLDPASLALRELEVKFRDGSNPSRYLPGAKGAVAQPHQAPANNPLFESGSRPRVNSN